MRNYYILSCLVVVLFVWYFHFNAPQKKSENYFKNLTNSRVAIANGITIDEKEQFDAYTMYIETPGQNYVLKYKDKPSDSLYVFHHYSKYKYLNPITYALEGQKLSVQLNPKIEVIHPQERQELYLPPQYRNTGYMTLQTVSRVLPKSIELSPFTYMDIDWDHDKKIDRVEIKLGEGAALQIHHMFIDTLVVLSKCNSSINFVGCTIQYLDHICDGGKIDSDNTTVEKYNILRSGTAWCSASVYLDVTKNIGGSIESTTPTEIQYINEPKIVLSQQKNTSFKKAAKLDYMEQVKEMMNKIKANELNRKNRK
ncbi:MAG TPA: hypothetical protein PKD85_21510 [Saprospiraceae bacterium]|nr:hypothetical protein [Saprospiraceae bacterium]